MPFPMNKARRARTVAVTAVLLGMIPVLAGAATLTPADRCEAGKLKLVGTYASCRLKEESTALSKGIAPDFSRCVEVFSTKFPKLEDNAGPMVCPTEDDLVDLRDRSDLYTAQVATLLSGGTLPATECGDGTIDLGEDCEAGNLDGQTCASQGFDSGALACGPGCNFDTSGCHSTRFEDNGSTVLDHQTGLEWEKKGSADGTANAADAHDVDNTYTWTAASNGTTMNGTLFTDFLLKLNGTVDSGTLVTGGCFANHCDWRLPTIDELRSIAILSPACGAAPCIQNALLAPAASARYWSISNRSPATGAYFVDFSSGVTAGNFKTVAYAARAVRSIR